jgi:hypothetical protein
METGFESRATAIIVLLISLESVPLRGNLASPLIGFEATQAASLRYFPEAQQTRPRFGGAFLLAEP